MLDFFLRFMRVSPTFFVTYTIVIMILAIVRDAHARIYRRKQEAQLAAIRRYVSLMLINSANQYSELLGEGLSDEEFFDPFLPMHDDWYLDSGVGEWLDCLLRWACPDISLMELIPEVDVNPQALYMLRLHLSKAVLKPGLNAQACLEEIEKRLKQRESKKP